MTGPPDSASPETIEVAQLMLSIAADLRLLEELTATAGEAAGSAA
ncbi:hypothetical protein [Streptomyces griseosporeus]